MPLPAPRGGAWVPAARQTRRSPPRAPGRPWSHSGVHVGSCPRARGDAPAGPAVVPPRLLMAACPAVPLAPVPGDRADRLLGVHGADVVADSPASQVNPEREVRVLGDGVGIPAAKLPQRRGPHGAVGAPVGG